jgi:hypothetical protein
LREFAVTSPVPAQPSTPGYFHADWREDALAALSRVAKMAQALTVMDACMDDVKAGVTQRSHVEGCREFAVQIMRDALQYVDQTDQRAIDINAAIQRAGGQHEVAQDKHYHQR